MTARRAAFVSSLLAAVLAALGAVSAFAAPKLTPSELLPDLVTLPFDGITIHPEGGRTVLRFGNTIGNEGLGVLELRPRRRDCDGDGDFSNDRLAIQRIYEDTNASGAFERGTDLIARTVEVGCMVFHPAHNHWHLQRFARYELRSVATDAVVAASPQGFVLRSGQRTRLPRPAGVLGRPGTTASARGTRSRGSRSGGPTGTPRS